LAPDVCAQFERHGITAILGQQAIYGSIHAVVAEHEDPPARDEAAVAESDGTTPAGPAATSQSA
ncbi:MAG TPA: hypothetical protein PK201_12740, partial [Accumulibacter sp.]|nr:hypothetical protein [Accumulibacter sp.]